MKTTLVAITGAATDVPATIPARFVRIKEDGGTPGEVLLANLLQNDGSYSADVEYPAGSDITLTRFVSILGIPADFSFKGQSATAHAKVRTKSGNSTNLRVIEHERPPDGNY